MRADGFNAEREILADFGEGLAGSNHAEHLVLAVRQFFVGWAVGIG